MKRSDELKAQQQAIFSKWDSRIKTGSSFSSTEQTFFDTDMSLANNLTDQIVLAMADERQLRMQRQVEMASLPSLTPEFGLDGGFPGASNNARVLTPTMTAFKGNGNKQQAARDAYDCGLWLQANIGGDGEARAKLESRRGATWLATQNENSPASGGYLVPTPMEQAVIVSREDVGALRKLARIIPMSSESLEVPKQSDGTTVYYPGEEGSITASDLDFGSAGLVAKKRAIYSLFSNELRDDALASIADLLASGMGHQFALKEDAEFVDGDGTSSYGGVAGLKNRNAAATASISTKRASRYISAIGKAANVITNKAEGQYATAHDLRRSFGTRWARRVTPAILRDLMRHSSIETTMTYYVSQAAEDVGDVLREALGTNLGTIATKAPEITGVDINANGVKILS